MAAGPPDSPLYAMVLRQGPQVSSVTDRICAEMLRRGGKRKK